MAKIVCRQMPALRELPQQIPASQAKARIQKPQDGGKFLVQIPMGARGVIMAKIDTCITSKENNKGTNKTLIVFFLGIAQVPRMDLVFL